MTSVGSYADEIIPIIQNDLCDRPAKSTHRRLREITIVCVSFQSVTGASADGGFACTGAGGSHIYFTYKIFLLEANRDSA